jgi:hypothetical protein
MYPVGSMSTRERAGTSSSLHVVDWPGRHDCPPVLAGRVLAQTVPVTMHILASLPLTRAAYQVTNFNFLTPLGGTHDGDRCRLFLATPIRWLTTTQPLRSTALTAQRRESGRRRRRATGQRPHRQRPQDPPADFERHLHRYLLRRPGALVKPVNPNQGPTTPIDDGLSKFVGKAHQHSGGTRNANSRRSQPLPGLRAVRLSGAERLCATR